MYIILCFKRSTKCIDSISNIASYWAIVTVLFINSIVRETPRITMCVCIFSKTVNCGLKLNLRGFWVLIFSLTIHTMSLKQVIVNNSYALHFKIVLRHLIWCLKDRMVFKTCLNLGPFRKPDIRLRYVVRCVWDAS